MLSKIKKGAKAFWAKILKVPVALLLVLAVVVIATILALGGRGERFNAGAIIGRWLSRKKEKESVPLRIRRANEPREEIPLEAPDDLGYVQREVKILKDNRRLPWRDKSILIIEREEGGKGQIALPQGILDVDVDEVLEIQPEVFEIVIKNTPDIEVDTDEVYKYLGPKGESST